MRRLSPFVFVILLAAPLSLNYARGVEGLTTHIDVAFNGGIPADIATRVSAAGGILEWRDDILGFITARTTNPDAFNSSMLSYGNVRLLEVDSVLVTPESGPQTNPPPGTVDCGSPILTNPPLDPCYWKSCGNVDCGWGLELINISRAWTVSQGSRQVIVAVVDTGMDYTHEDLTDDVARQADGTPFGMDFANFNFDPQESPGGYHGTMVSGVVGATSNNNRGIAGTAAITILPVKVYDRTHGGTPHQVASGIAWASAQNARVIIMPFAIFTGPDPLIDLALDYAATLGAGGKGSLLVASAGNANGPMSYPASNAHVLGVGAVDQSGQAANYSAVDARLGLVAPGGSNDKNDANDILTTFPGGLYWAQAGTSFSAPYVAGVAGLMFSVKPSATAQTVVSVLKNTADDKGVPGPDSSYGYGQVNPFAAVSAMLPGDPPQTGSPVFAHHHDDRYWALT